MGISLDEWEGEADGDQLDPIWLDPIWTFLAGAPREIVAQRIRVLTQMGRAVLHLRLFLGWTQRDLEHFSGVDQTTISRFERGRHQSLSVHRLAAMLAALRVGAIEFKPPPGPPPTPLEIMLYGDRWALAGKAADRRLARRRLARRRRERAA